MINKNYTVWSPQHVVHTSTWMGNLKFMMKQIAEKGLFIFVFTQGTIKSQLFKKELSFAVSIGASIIPIIIGKLEIPENLKILIGNMQQFTVEPTEEEFAKVLDIAYEALKDK